MNNSFAGQNNHPAGSADSVATAFYTGVSVPYNVKDPATVVTLKDGAHPWIEVQAVAATVDTSLGVWDKHVYYQPAPAPETANTRSPQFLNPVMPSLPYPCVFCIYIYYIVCVCACLSTCH